MIWGKGLFSHQTVVVVVVVALFVYAGVWVCFAAVVEGRTNYFGAALAFGCGIGEGGLLVAAYFAKWVFALLGSNWRGCLCGFVVMWISVWW